MDKMNPRDLKRFEIKSQEEAMMVLGTLIAQVKENLEKYTMYQDELEKLIAKYEPLNDDKETLISAKEYDDINDKLLFRQREMLKFCSDQQKDSFAYIELRPTFIKKGFLKSTLNTTVSEILNNFRDIRNWTFHNTQSAYTASREVAFKGMPEELKKIATPIPQINPLLLPKTVSYDFLYVISSSIHAEKIKNDFTLILQAMISDYKEMFAELKNRPFLIPGGDSLQVIEKKVTHRLMDHITDSTQISMAIQKSKYSGTQEDFDKYAIFSSKEKKEDPDAKH